MADDKVVIDIVAKDDTQKGIKKAEQSFKGLSATVTKLAAAGFGIAAIKNFGEAMFDANVESQKLNASLTSVLGSSEAAARAFKNLSDFASKTPFQLNEVVQAFIKMKSLGLDATEEALMSFGNTASAMGKDLNQMIEAVADASTGEFERLKEFGIKSKSEGDKVSFTFQGVTTTVKKNATEITDFLRTIGDEKFGDAMSEQMKTLGGAVSNAQDSWNKFLVALGESGIASAAAASIGVLTVALNQLTEALDPTIQGHIQDLTNELIQLENQLDEATGDGTRDAGSFGESLQAAIDDKAAQIEALRVKVKEDKDLAAEEAKAAVVAKTPETPEVKEKREQDAQDIELDALMVQLENDQKIRDLEIEQLDLQNQLKVELYDADVKAKEQAEKAKGKAEQDARDAGMQALSDLGSLMNSENKKAFEIGKAARISETVINTYASATSAFKAMSGIPVVGPALGAVAAAAAVAAGLANVQAISATQFGGKGSGTPSVPSFSSSGGVASTQPVGQPQNAASIAQQVGDNIEVRTGSVIGVLIEEEIIPALIEAQTRGVKVVIT